MTDVLVIGSGISGALAAKGLIDAGATVTMLDIGMDDNLRDRVPDVSFSQLRRNDPQQAAYLIGKNLEGVGSTGVKVGAQLTPPRQFIQRGADDLLPYRSKTFFPMIPVSLGGLGAGWGAACFTFTPAEFERTGIGADLSPFYQQAANIVGISAEHSDEYNRDLWSGVTQHQSLLEIDSNAESILTRATSGKLAPIGMTLGRIPLAILSSDHGTRRANPYTDMDFYGDVRESIFRPRYLIRELRKNPRFTYCGGQLALRFVDRKENGVRFYARDITSGRIVSTEARKAILCAGALNSARIALQSLGLPGVRTTVLCNPYTYMPAVNLAMLGRSARDRRYSMAQIGGILRQENSSDAFGCHQMYSYRALMLFKLVKEMPLPPALGLLTARILVNALAVFGIFFLDEQSESKHLSIQDAPEDQAAPLSIDYRQSAEEMARQRRHEDRFRRGLRRLGCIPIGRIDPGKAASIHYAGTIPYSNPLNPQFHAETDCTLADHPNIYLGDGAPWNFLPCKGLSFTLMANALRVAAIALRAL